MSQSVPAQYATDIYSERLVCAAAMVLPDSAQSLCAAAQGDDFTSPWLRTVWQAIEGCVRKEQPPTLPNVASVLLHWGKLDEYGGEGFLVRLVDDMLMMVGIAARRDNLLHYARTLHQLGDRRRAAAAMLAGDVPEKPNKKIRGGLGL